MEINQSEKAKRGSYVFIISFSGKTLVTIFNEKAQKRTSCLHRDYSKKKNHSIKNRTLFSTITNLARQLAYLATRTIAN